MKYYSTRSKKDNNGVKSAQVIKQGIARDGGLFMPERIPTLSQEDISALTGMNYIDRAAFVLGLFLTDFGKEELQKVTRAAYSQDSFPEGATKIVRSNNNHLLELWHGPTSAFKDMALQILPHLLSLSLDKTGEDRDALILVATSGDTGKAALEGFAQVDRTYIQVFFPRWGVSNIQKLQMVSQKGDNVDVCGITGNFDDAQNGVKKIFGDREVSDTLNKMGMFLSSANSINWGRLVPQVVYYISAYCDLIASKELKPGQEFNITVPTGNFGNIFAAYLAKQMGIPIKKLICASNKNDILTDFLTTGVYDKRREFFTTVSPSMDILISSNLERLIYLFAGPELCKGYMEDLSKEGVFRVDSHIMEEIREHFVGLSCDEENTADTIDRYYTRHGYLMDTHTAVATYCADEYKKGGDDSLMLIASTASPYKFASSVLSSLGQTSTPDEFSDLEKLNSITEVDIPDGLARLRAQEVIYNDTIQPEDMRERVLDFAKSKREKP